MGVSPSENFQPEGPGFLIRVYSLIWLDFTTASRVSSTLGLILGLSSCVLLLRFFFLHDNAPAHKAASVCQFLTPQKNVTTLFHLPYPPDLSLPDSFMFPKLKMKLKGLRFADGAEIQEAVTDELQEVEKEEFLGSFSETVQPRRSLCICQWTKF